MSEPILTAGELDALRDAVESNDGQIEVGPASSSGVVLDGSGLSRFRFGEGPIGGTGRQERLSYVFDRLSRALETRLSDIFERTVSSTVTFLKLTRFAEFREVFEVDVRELAMLAFQIPGQHGQGLIAMEPELVERIVEGLMGGASPPGEESGEKTDYRAVTALDLRICRRVVGGLVDDLGRLWNPGQPLQPQITSSDTTGVVARVYSDSTPVISALLEVSAGRKLMGMIAFVLPRGALDVLADPSNKDASAEETEEAPAVVPSGPLARELPGFEVKVEVHLGSRRMTVRELLALKQGSVIYVPGHSGAICSVQGVPKFVGVPGKKNGNKAIRLAGALGRKNNAN